MAADRRTGVRFTESHKQLIKLLAAVAVDEWVAEQEEEKHSKKEDSPQKGRKGVKQTD